MKIIKNIAALIAWRYLRYKQKDAYVSFMIKVCFLGILIGTFALMLTLIITNGFEKAIHEKMRGINAQIIVSSPGNKLDYLKISKSLKEEFGSYIKGIGGTSLKQAILDKQKTHSVLFLKGIDPEVEATVTTLADKVVQPFQTRLLSGTQKLKQLLKPDQIIIGHKTAIEQHLKVGQEITLLIPEPKSQKRIALKKHVVTVSGIFKVGLEEYDSNLAFITLDTLNEMFDEEGVEQITLSLHEKPLPPTNQISPRFFSTQWWKTLLQKTWSSMKNLWSSQDQEHKVAQLLRQRFPHLTVSTWKELYPALVASLKLEKYVMFFIIALITLVASMNMISLLFMQIQHKLRDIAIFKAMGLANKQLRKIFLYMGMTITVCASLCGLFFAFLVGFALEHYPFIQLPDVYYISYLPARIEPEIFVVVFLVTILLGFLATWIPAQRSTKINIANVLRQE